MATAFTVTDGENPYTGSAVCPAPGMPPGSQVEVDGSTDLAAVITGNSGALVNWITLNAQPPGAPFPYVLEVNGQGPAGMGSGGMELVFTDAAGGTNSLTLDRSTPETHTLKYGSGSPNIVSFTWAPSGI